MYLIVIFNLNVAIGGSLMLLWFQTVRPYRHISIIIIDIFVVLFLQCTLFLSLCTCCDNMSMDMIGLLDGVCCCVGGYI